MSILRVLYPERYKSKKIDEKVKFYEKPRPHVMYHADTMEVTLGNRSVIHQISVEDDYSRGYMALCVFPKKHSYFVVLTILRAFRSHSKPELFHHDNGGEFDNGVVFRISFANICCYLLDECFNGEKMTLQRLFETIFELRGEVRVEGGQRKVFIARNSKQEYIMRKLESALEIINRMGIEDTNKLIYYFKLI